MRSFKKWTESGLLKLCKQHGQESLTLEFKGKDTIDKNQTNDIAKIVCALANADGGQVIFGVKEGKGGRAECLEEGWDPEERKADWLESVILPNVTPKVDFEVVRVKRRASGKELYVVNISPSSTAHQAKDGVFYKRRNFRCDPMNYQEIEEVRNRRARPSVDVEIDTDSEGLDVFAHVSASSTNTIRIFFKVWNRSSVKVDYLQLHVWFPFGEVNWAPELENVDIVPWRSQDIEDPPSEWQILKGKFVRQTLKLSPSDGFFLIESEHPYILPPLAISCRSFIGVTPMPWKIEVPGMRSKTGALLLWVSKDKIFSSESIGIDFDWNRLEGKFKMLVGEKKSKS